ncbi:MAG: efflux transporter outer membrane subunit [Nibricoccus sp.]
MPDRYPRSSRFRALPPTLAALASMLITAGCVSSTSTNAAGSAQLETPAAWKNSTPATTAASPAPSVLDTTALREWWRQFNDPVLNQLVADALASSTDIRTALARIDESRARHGVQRSSLFPSVTGSASGQNVRQKVRASDTTQQAENYSASLDASWELDLFGKLRASNAGTAADLKGSIEDFHAAQVSLAAEVATNYVALRSAEAQAVVVEKSLKSRGETIQLLQWQQQSGGSDALATQQAVSTYEQARASLPSLQQTIAQTRNALALLTAKTPGALDTLLATTGKLPPSPAATATGIPAETLNNRPDVRSAADAYEAAALRTTAAQRARLPSLTLSGSIGVEALKAGKLFDPVSTISSVAGSLTAPLFDAGQRKQTVQIQDALQRQALLSYQSTVLTALSEVESALIAVQRTAERLDILDRSVAAAREASQLADMQYQAGSVDILTVLDAQRTLLSVEQQQVTTRAEQLTAHIQLYKSLGGGWTPLNTTHTASL